MTGATGGLKGPDPSSLEEEVPREDPVDRQKTQRYQGSKDRRGVVLLYRRPCVTGYVFSVSL